MNIRSGLTALALCLVSSLAWADDDDRHVDWSYLQLSDLNYDLNLAGVDAEPDGYKLKLSLELGDSLFGIVDRSRSEDTVFGQKLDFDTEGYGFGFHGHRWFASYTYSKWDYFGNEFDVDTLRVGFRRHWSDQLEFNASYAWNNIEDADTEDGFQIGFAFELWDHFDLTADYETVGGHLDVDYWAFGVRFDF